MGKGPRIDCSKEPNLTQQSAKDECDINLIVERAKRGADISHLSSRAPMYGDFTGLPSYREALLLVNKARDAFMALDARVRERFANDPGLFLEFVQDPNNREEAIKLGLVVPPPPAKPDEGLETLKSIDKSLKGKVGAGHGKGPKGDGDEA